MTQGAPRRSRTPGPAVLAAILVVIGIGAGAVLALAGGPRTPARTAGPPGTADLASLGAPATGTPEPSNLTSPPSTGSGFGSGLVVDSALLGVLPTRVKDLALAEDPESEARDLADAALGAEASGIAAALVVDPASGDFAYASVVALRPGIYSDAYFRSWRETFDEGACAQAGGVAGSSAEATLAGHRTFIGHCAGGILTYHVYLVERGLIVSISAVGTARFGQLLVEGLR